MPCGGGHDDHDSIIWVQFMDKYGNLAEKGEVVDLALEGLKLCDRKGGSTRKVH